MDPTTLAAGAIAKIAFDEFIKSGAGEVAKKTVGGAIDLVKNLRDRIKAKFQGNERAEKAIAEVEQQGTPTALEKVAKYLDVEFDEDGAFADEIRQIAQQIINIQNKSTVTLNQTNINYGRDQNIMNFNQPPGDLKVGG
jgi:hypothetical protein